MASLSDVALDEGLTDACDVDLVHVAEVQRARATQPSPEVLQRSAEILGLLANPTRLAIVLALAGEDGGPAPLLCVCDLAAIARARDSQTSHQLRALRLAGVVSQRRDGRLVYYRLAEDPLVRGVARALVGARP